MAVEGMAEMSANVFFGHNLGFADDAPQRHLWEADDAGVEEDPGNDDDPWFHFHPGLDVFFGEAGIAQALLHGQRRALLEDLVVWRCWVVGLLGCWAVGLLGCWAVGLLVVGLGLGFGLVLVLGLGS